MSSEITADSYPNEYASPPVYHRVPSIWALQKVQSGMTQAEALRDELPATVRETQRS